MSKIPILYYMCEGAVQNNGAVPLLVQRIITLTTPCQTLHFLKLQPSVLFEFEVYVAATGYLLNFYFLLQPPALLENEFYVAAIGPFGIGIL